MNKCPELQAGLSEQIRSSCSVPGILQSPWSILLTLFRPFTRPAVSQFLTNFLMFPYMALRALPVDKPLEEQGPRPPEVCTL